MQRIVTIIEGRVVSREMRNERMHFSVEHAQGLAHCLDMTGSLGPFAVYPGRMVRCVSYPSEAIQGLFEVQEVQAGN